MRFLFGKTFGLGNAVMAVPALKALRTLGIVDILIGSTQDDGGAWDVFKHLQHSNIIDHIYTANAKHGLAYDVAIMSIPFDGRWKNGVHFDADKVVDCRTRPDPSTTGLISWKKHEIEYQMDNMHDLGYLNSIPSTSFYSLPVTPGKNIYLGVGYKKDQNNFWSKKHYGNKNYSQLISTILNEYQDYSIISTGDQLDWKLSLQPIKKAVSNNRFSADITNLDTAFSMLANCCLYIGNDTGMMHVAASMNIPCIAPFFLENSIVKSRPWGNDHVVFDCFNKEISPNDIMKEVRKKLD